MGLVLGFQGRWGLTIGREVRVKRSGIVDGEAMVGHDEEVQLRERECWTSGTRRRISGKVKEVGAAEK